VWFKSIPIWIKAIILHIIFILLHYLYDWFPNPVTTICSGVNESVFQHMKIGFFAYNLLTLIEFGVIFRAVQDRERYFYSRLFAATYLPLVMMVVYLIGPLVFNHFESVVAEIIFANVALFITSLIALVVEKHVEKIKPDLGFKILIVLLFFISLAQFVLFTFDLPWFDIFAVPPGW